MKLLSTTLEISVPIIPWTSIENYYSTKYGRIPWTIHIDRRHLTMWEQHHERCKSYIIRTTYAQKACIRVVWHKEMYNKYVDSLSYEQFCHPVFEDKSYALSSVGRYVLCPLGHKPLTLTLDAAFD